MIVLGIDPGTAATGYGVVSREGGGAVSLVECGVVRTDDSLELAARLRTVHEGILEIIDRHRPDRIAVEGVFYARNVRTTVTLGHTRGAILLAAALRDRTVAEYSPAEIKNAVCGTGRGTKQQVQFMVQQLLRLKAPPKPADAADGVAVALCDIQSSALRVHLAASQEAQARARGQGQVKGQGGVGRLLRADQLPPIRG
ncbi:MAG TPA: crossover junction endodeoxyribonuclease RuvC [Longimicrobiales bacterium]|nr:crossover junction endodeoxyribonuclease RuvC [Longimicrobiales bacterium]